MLSVFFAGISGSSTADAASQSKIFIEAQTKEGYDLSFSVAITAVSAVLAVDHPALDPDDRLGRHDLTSIGALFLAGVVPGLLIAVAQMATVHVYAKRRGYPTYPRSTLRELLCAIWIVDPGADDARSSSSAARSSAGSPPPSRPAWRCCTRPSCRSSSIARWACEGLYDALLDTGKLAAIALFCVGTASAFGWLLAYYKIPQG